MLHKLTIYLGFVLIVFMALASTPAYSGQVTYADDTYKSGDKLTAADLNGKFNEIKVAVNNNDSRVAALEEAIASLLTTVSILQEDLSTANTTIAGLQTTLATHSNKISGINNSNIMALDPYLTVTSAGFAKAQFSGINLQLINGAGTDMVNGLGNLIIGYDNIRTTGNPTCSLGAYDGDQLGCENAGETWAVSHKSGSHYLVIGNENNYSRHDGMVVGWKNSASGNYSTVSAGRENSAIGSFSSISGGNLNKTITNYSSVSGGTSNKAFGVSSSVSGGELNTANGINSSVSGGQGNIAGGNWTSVSGGQSRAAVADYEWRAGTL